MAIYLPGTQEEQELALDELTPREIVSELDKYVVGQNAAKRAHLEGRIARSRRIFRALPLSITWAARLLAAVAEVTAEIRRGRMRYD